jgi:hypothetical protein
MGRRVAGEHLVETISAGSRRAVSDTLPSYVGMISAEPVRDIPDERSRPIGVPDERSGTVGGQAGASDFTAGAAARPPVRRRSARARSAGSKRATEGGLVMPMWTEEDGTTRFVCEVCGCRAERIDRGEGNYDERRLVVHRAKEDGWSLTKRRRGSWEALCPDCSRSIGYSTEDLP